MRILLGVKDLFSEVGGGQSFFADLIKASPQHQFWYFAEGRSPPKALLPDNAHPLRVSNAYRGLVGSEFDLGGAEIGGLSLGGNEGELLRQFDWAASAAGLSFDVLEIPDFAPYAALLPLVLRHQGVGIGRVVLSMHGLLSDALTGNWGRAERPDLGPLRPAEDLLYRSVDLRYGISAPYLAQWRGRSDLDSCRLALTDVLPLETFAALRRKSGRAAGGPPRLAFIGRQEKWKGPDLFVDLVCGLDPQAYREALFVGPPVVIEGVDSWTELTRMARRRSLDLKRIEFERGELWGRLAAEPWLGVFPSRKDTLNLSALETLLCGAPAAISRKAGVCGFLDDAFPGIPHLRFDPDDLPAARDGVEAMLANYDREKRRLLDYLDTAKPAKVGLSLDEIYRRPPDFDPAARGELQAAFGVVAGRVEAAAIEDGRRRMRVSLAGPKDKSGKRGPGWALAAYDSVPAVAAILAEAAAMQARSGFLSDEAMERLWRRLEPFVFTANRTPIYGFLAEAEALRANPLLSATYAVRCMRLSGEAEPRRLDEVRAILADQGFPREAEALRLMYGPGARFAATLDHLRQGPRAFSSPPEGGIVAERRFGALAKPKISVVVSLYKAADKLPLFLHGLGRFTEAARRTMEVVLVDSASPDDTEAVIAAELARLDREGRGFAALYLRTEQRETIQKAWNRGIAVARGDYLCFLGADEMNRPDALEMMADYLDAHPGIDWVQGSALVTEVNAQGSFTRDLMLYDRRFDRDFMNLLDTCYVSYVGAMYRRSLHDRVGYYDDSFRAAGDTEFKNRALPHMRVATLPETLGWFLNYPDERTTQSPAAEIEDIRAWYLHRTPAGAAYQLEGRGDREVEQLLLRCLDYRKTYMDTACTDVELGASLADYISRRHLPARAKPAAAAKALTRARALYRRLDDLSALAPDALGPTLHKADRDLRALSKGLGAAKVAGFGFTNDNRSHQHHWLWPSHTPRLALEPLATRADLGQAHDLVELLDRADGNGGYAEAWNQPGTPAPDALLAASAPLVLIEAAHLSDPGVVAQAWDAHASSSGVVAVVLGQAPSTSSSLCFTRALTDHRPLFAAAQVVAIPAAGGDEARAARKLLRALALGRPVVAEASVVAALAALVPEVDLSGLATKDVADLIQAAAKIATDLKAARVALDAGLAVRADLERTGLPSPPGPGGEPLGLEEPLPICLPAAISPGLSLTALAAGGTSSPLRSGRSSPSASWRIPRPALDPATREVALTLEGLDDPATGADFVRINGFYEREAPRGQPAFRWIGPGRVGRVVLPVMLFGPARLDLVIQHLGPNSAETLSLRINGRPMTPQVRTLDGAVELSCDLPHPTTGFLSIEVEAGLSFAPPGDSRRLAVALSSLTVTVDV